MVDGMLAIDMHNHVFKHQMTVHGYYGQTMEELIERMDRNGIDRALISPGPAGLTPNEFSKLNNYIIEAVQKYPDRFSGSCTTTPVHGQRSLDEVERCAKAGLIGVKLRPHVHGYYAVDGEIMNPLMEKIAELHMIVSIHSDFDHKRCSPYQIVLLAKRFPQVTILMAHMGLNPDNTKIVPDLVKATKNVILDTAGTPNIPNDVFARPMKIVPDQVVLGSDTPSLSPEVELKKVEVAEQLYGLTKGQKRKLLGQNAVRILGLSVSSS